MQLTTAEAAERLGIQPRSVVGLIRQGRLSGVKRGRDYLLEEEEVDRYKRERRPVGRPRKEENNTQSDSSTRI